MDLLDCLLQEEFAMARKNVSAATWKRVREVIDEIRAIASSRFNKPLEKVTYYDMELVTDISHESIRRYYEKVALPDRRSMIERLARPLGKSPEDISYYFMTGKWPITTNPTKEYLIEHLAQLAPDEQWEVFRKASEKKMSYVA